MIEVRKSFERLVELVQLRENVTVKKSVDTEVDKSVSDDRDDRADALRQLSSFNAQ